MRRNLALGALLVAGLVAAGVYVATQPDATPVAGASGPVDWSDVEGLREDAMRKLAFVAEPAAAPDITFEDEDGAPLTLAAFQGEYVVLNFWATWCAPCRKEMPSLDRLQTTLASAPDGTTPARVVTVATGRNDPAAIERFFAEVGVESLPKYRDPNSALARGMGVAGLPITVLIDPAGREIARLIGDAEWDTDSAKAILTALTAPAG